MVFGYCETCQKVSSGKYMTAATQTIKIFYCDICHAMTYINYNDKYFDEIFESDFAFRNEVLKLQREIYSK